MPATIANWKPSKNGRSANGIGCAPSAPLTAVNDLTSVPAMLCCAARAPESRAFSRRAWLCSSATRASTSSPTPRRRSLSGSNVPSSRKRMNVRTASAGARCRAIRGRAARADCTRALSLSAEAAFCWPSSASTTMPSTHGRKPWARSVCSRRVSRRSSAVVSPAAVAPGATRNKNRSGGSAASAASVAPANSPPCRASNRRSTPRPACEKSCHPASD